MFDKLDPEWYEQFVAAQQDNEPVEPQEPDIVCPQCWDETEYDGDDIMDITRRMCGC